MSLPYPRTVLESTRQRQISTQVKSASGPTSGTERAAWYVFPKPSLAPLLTDLEAPEGPHIYYKDGYYYLLAAEGKGLVYQLLGTRGLSSS